MLVGVWSPKGGSGVSVLTTTCALLASREQPVLLVDCDGDLPAVLGHATDHRPGVRDLFALDDLPIAVLDRLIVEAAPNLRLLGAGDASAPQTVAGGERVADALRARGGPVFIDLGAASAVGVRALAGRVDTLVMVIRPCYLAFRRATADPLARASRGAVVIEEPNRSLGARDLEHVLGLPVLATITPRSAVARAVDAGTLSARLPEPLARPVRVLLDQWGLAPDRLVA
jgi:hypothetical protein